MRSLNFIRFFSLFGNNLRGVVLLCDVIDKSGLQMINVSTLLALFMYMFTILAMQFFATTRRGAATSTFADFSDFPNAAMTLWQITSGENWPAMMRDLSVEPPFCTEPLTSNDTGDCGNAIRARLFFYVYFVLTFCVFLNLCVNDPASCRQ